MGGIFRGGNMTWRGNPWSRSSRGMRAEPHGRQASRTVGSDWLKPMPYYHTGLEVAAGLRTWPGLGASKSSKGPTLELRPSGASRPLYAATSATLHKGGTI